MTRIIGWIVGAIFALGVVLGLVVTNARIPEQGATTDDVKAIVADAIAQYEEQYAPPEDEETTPPEEEAAPPEDTVPPDEDTDGSQPDGSMDPVVAHFARLSELDPVFRSSGVEAWLQAAGITWSGVLKDARQIEEEVRPDGKIVAAGVQVEASNLSVPWPNIVTTDVPGRITETSTMVSYTPDPANGSTLYTNVVANGPVTIWIDGQNWGQFTSVLGFTSAPADGGSAPTDRCLSLTQLKSYGTVLQELEYPEGVLAGAQLRLTQDFTPPEGWTLQRQGSDVSSAKAGETVSAWSPEDCRPLAR